MSGVGPRERPWDKAYAAPGQLTTAVNPSFPSTPFVTNSYDSLGRVMTQTDATSRTWQYFFAGTRSEEVDPKGTQHVLYTTARGRTRLDIQDLDGLNLRTTTTHDGLDRPVKTSLPANNSISYEYDLNSNVITATRNDKGLPTPVKTLVTSAVYDPTFNKPIRITDPRGLVTTLVYDGAGNLLSVVANSTGTAKATTSYTWTGAGLPLTVTDPMGTVTTYSYDEAGNRLSMVEDAGPGRLNRTTLYGYNAWGDVVSLTDPNGNVTRSQYDAARRLVTTTLPSTSASPGGLVTTNTYDADGRLLQVQQSSGGSVLRTTSATWTPTGKPETTTDANGNVTRYTYDLLDRQATLTDAMGRVTEFTYDAVSRPFETFNRAIKPAGAMLRQTWTPDGKLASLTDANGNTTTFEYDGFNRLKKTTYPDPVSGLAGSTEEYTYDGVDNVLTRKTRAGATITFGYDTLYRLTSKTPPSGPAVTYAYDLASRPTSVGDNSAAIVSAVSPTGSTVTYATTFTYDALNRPTGVAWDPAPAVTAPAAGPLVTFGHSYDKTNRRIGQTVDDNTWLAYPTGAPSTTSYTANALNQYSAVTGLTPSYSTNGNLTGDGTYTYGYDAENRLVSASGAGNTASYAYDGRGWRKSRTVNGTTTISVTDADNREVLEYDGGTGAIQRWYAYGLGPNDVLNQMNVQSSTRSSFLPDIQNSIIATFSSTAALAKSAYLPYGGSTAPADPFGYTGQRSDPEAGALYYYRARQYSSALGRYLQPDPLGYSDGSNLYSYVRNDALNAIDPNGEFLNVIAGGLLNVAIGYGISRLTGEEYSLGDAAVDFGIGAATGGLAALAAARRGAQIVEGVYVVGTKSGAPYVGQSSNIPRRLGEHVDAGTITQSAANSATRLEVLGGQTSREVAEQLAINSRGGVPTLANQVNPIGGRPWLADNLELGVVTKTNIVNWPAVVGADILSGALLSSSPAQGASTFGLPSASRSFGK